MIIDFHTHLDDAWFDEPLIVPRAFVDGLDKSGITKACVFTMMGFYGDCSRANDRLLERVAYAPNRLIPFLTVDPKLGSAAVAELDRCLRNALFRGIKFHGWLQSFAPAMCRETMIDILERAAVHRLPVLFHDGTPPFSTTYQVAEAARLVPDATVVLGHAGLADYVYSAGRLMQSCPNLYACVCGPRGGDIRYLVNSGGADRVLFGSDFGVCGGRLIEERLDDVRHAGLTDREVSLVLGANAQRILRIETEPAVDPANE